MPAIVVLEPLNQLLADPAGPGYQTAAAAVGLAGSVREALERVDVLGGFTPEIQAEARAVLDALPEAVHDALLAALRSGLRRQLPIRLRWAESDVASVRVTEVGNRVRIKIKTPDGREFV